MQLTVVLPHDIVASVEVEDDATAAAVLAAVEAQTGAPAAAHALTFNGAPLRPGAPLAGQGVAGGDLVVAVPLGPPAPPAGAAASAAADPAAVRMLAELRRPEVYARLPPAVRALVDGGDTAAVAALAHQMAQGGGGGGNRSVDPEEERLHAEAESDPFNPEIQKKLEQLVQRKNALENYEGAMESFPEAFGDVVMLYIPVELNGVALTPLVDSGAQMTVMTATVAQRCGLMHLLDVRFAGTASGVGSAPILGRVHMAPLRAGGHFFPVSITVMDQPGEMFLFGLDNLKRHQCVLDLKAHALRFGTTGTELKFLAEHEIPAKDNPAAAERLAAAETEAAVAASRAKPAAGGAGGAGGGGAGGSAPAAAAAPSAPAAPSAAPAAAAPAAWEEKVARLAALGFPREACEGALRAAGGDEEMAGSLLFVGA